MSLTLKNLKFRFSDKYFFGPFNCQLNSGETVGLIGANGAGKSTLIKLLCGEIHPTCGDVCIDEHSLALSALEYKRKLGYMPDSFPLDKHFTVKTFIEFIATAKGMSEQFTQQRWEDLSSKLGLTDLNKMRLNSLSLGQRQKLSLAQAILNQPSCLILDEPLNGLDPAQQENFWQILEAFTEKPTILMASHHLSDLLAHCDRLLIMDQLQLVADFHLQRTCYLIAYQSDNANRDKALSKFRIFDDYNEYHKELGHSPHIFLHGSIEEALPQLFRHHAVGEWTW